VNIPRNEKGQFVKGWSWKDVPIEIREKRIAKIKEKRAKQTPPTLGYKFSEESRKKKSKIAKKANRDSIKKALQHFIMKRKGKTYEEIFGVERAKQIKEKLSLAHMGDKSVLWKGGVSENYKNRVSERRWNEIRKIVYKRDNWQCQICGKHCHDDIQCHHIIPFVESKDDSLDNLITLCKSHHAKIERSCNKSFWQYYLKRHIKISLN